MRYAVDNLRGARIREEQAEIQAAARRARRALGVEVRLTVPRGMTLWDVAEHEAAHAVVALACGSLVWGLGLDGGNSWAMTYHTNSHPVALFAVAGNEQRRRSWIGLGDARVFADAIRDLGQKPSPGHLWRYRQRARAILARYQPAVRALTRALMRARYLGSERQIRRLAFKASPELRQWANPDPCLRTASKFFRFACAAREPLEDRQLLGWNFMAFMRAEKAGSGVGVA